MSDIRLFTSKAYLGELMPPGAPRAYVTPATWLNEDWILGDEEAVAAWAAKQGPVRLVYAGRLVSAKGVSVLLAAIRAAAEAGTDAEFVIHPIGDDSLRDECVAAARSLAGKVAVTIAEEVPFGEPFLGFLRGFDAVLVPSLSDEQPRIAYEAFSQAVPVIGSATGGICEVVESGVNGRLSPPNDVGAAGGIAHLGRPQSIGSCGRWASAGWRACGTRPTRRCTGTVTSSSENSSADTPSRPVPRGPAP